nr:immunoglobulin light chain junction region [Macaca mulatta]
DSYCQVWDSDSEWVF